MDVGGLVAARQAPSIIQASFRVVGTDVVVVSLRQFLDTFLNASVHWGEKEECYLATLFISSPVAM